MVPLRGFAPRSPLYKSGSLLLAYRGVNFGGANQTRTDDHSTYPKLMVEKIGCAPTFPECKSGALSTELQPQETLAALAGFEPAHVAVKVLCLKPLDDSAIGATRRIRIVD